MRRAPDPPGGHPGGADSRTSTPTGAARASSASGRAPRGPTARQRAGCPPARRRCQATRAARAAADSRRQPRARRRRAQIAREASTPPSRSSWYIAVWWTSALSGSSIDRRAMPVEQQIARRGGWPWSCASCRETHEQPVAGRRGPGREDRVHDVEARQIDDARVDPGRIGHRLVLRDHVAAGHDRRQRRAAPSREFATKCSTVASSSGNGMDFVICHRTSWSRSAALPGRGRSAGATRGQSLSGTTSAARRGAPSPARSSARRSAVVTTSGSATFGPDRPASRRRRGVAPRHGRTG